MARAPNRVRLLSDAPSYSLQVPATPEMATTVRVFAAGSARVVGSDEERVQDLLLVATELLANTIETGGRRLLLTLSADGTGWLITAQGVGSVATGPGDPVDRRALIGSFASMRELEDGLELRALSGAADR
jgi:anti-sigma regulatory factor (Ser/Thr protein kinase)